MEKFKAVVFDNDETEFQDSGILTKLSPILENLKHLTENVIEQI